MTQPDERDPKVDELTSALLRSFREDVAPSHAKRATLAALGIGVATTAAAGSASALATAAAAGSASALAGVARVGALAIAKAVACGALAGAVVVGTSTYLQRRTPAPPTVLQRQIAPGPTSGGPGKTETSAAPPPAGAPEETISGVDEGSPSSARPLSPVERPRHEGTGWRVNPTATPLPADTLVAPAPDLGPVAKPSALGREIALLDESRRALAGNDATEALRLLDRYAREFPGGSLWPEAVVLRVDSLLRHGDVQPARLLAAQFEQARPNDSNILRVRSLFSRAKVSPPPDLTPNGK